MSDPDRRRPAAMIAGVLVAILSGGAAALQTRINSELSAQLGDGLVAAVLSFGSGLLVLTVLVLIAPSGRSGLVTLQRSVAAGETPWWFLSGGMFGAVFVIGQNFAAAALGVALFTIAMVAAQTVSGTVIDRVGVGDLERRPVSAMRVGASALAVVTVTFAGLSELRVDAPLGLLIFPVLAGLGIGWQQAVNGQVRSVSGSHMVATFVNFLLGTIVVVVAMIVHVGFAGWPRAYPDDPLLYTGGLLGIVFIAGATLVVRRVGVLLLGLGTISGQLVGALLIDLLAPSTAHPLALTTVIGTLLTLVAVSLAVVSTRHTPTATA